MSTLPTAVVSVTIDAPYDTVAAYVADPARAHEWATEFFAGPLTPAADGEWVAEVPMMGGPTRYRQETALEHGVIDLFLAPQGAPFGPPLPVRLLRNGDGVDVLYVLTRFPGAQDEQWEAGLASMRRELTNLKKNLEPRD